MLAQGEMEKDHIEIANQKGLDQFRREYMPRSNEWISWTHPKTTEEYCISLETSVDLTPTDFEACFRLIEAGSAEDYKKSKDGWRPKMKRKEMRLLDLKYLLVKHNDRLKGFASFMPTHEDSHPVIYCYEIHLDPSLQGTGMGGLLMGLLDIVAANIDGVEKVMLTMFRRNSRAVQFYRKLGFRTDEYSPSPRTLRDGTKVEESYAILSKSAKR